MNRAGETVAVLQGNLAYKAYKPSPLPPSPSLVVDEAMASLLSEASAAIAKLDLASSLVPDMDLFLGAYVRKEALLSSQIEGAQATLEDVLDPDSSSSTDADIEDVVNAVKATRFALDRMKELPLCCRLLKETHAVLLSNVRGQEKNPGEFRRSQNWIGSSNSSLKTARYVPPTVEDMEKAMGDLETFLNESPLHPLLKAALSHYQFETIHPFLDGNGRIGRLLITLGLIADGLLREPVLYLSLFLKENQTEYYDRLSEVRRKGDYEQWVRFFLRGVKETATSGLSTVLALDALVKGDEARIKGNNAQNSFRYLKSHPIVSVKTVAQDLVLSYNTVMSAFARFVSLGILKETTEKERNRRVAYVQYLEILKEGI